MNYLRWQGPLSSETSLAFLADRTCRVLKRGTPSIDMNDKQVLEEAEQLLRNALEGQRLLEGEIYQAAAASQFRAYGWLARVLATAGVQRTSPDEVKEALRSMIDALERVRDGRQIEEPVREDTCAVFTGLRERALAKASRPSDRFALSKGVLGDRPRTGTG